MYRRYRFMFTAQTLNVVVQLGCGYGRDEVHTPVGVAHLHVCVVGVFHDDTVLVGVRHTCNGGVGGLLTGLG